MISIQFFESLVECSRAWSLTFGQLYSMFFNKDLSIFVYVLSNVILPGGFLRLNTCGIEKGQSMWIVMKWWWIGQEKKSLVEKNIGEHFYEESSDMLTATDEKEPRKSQIKKSFYFGFFLRKERKKKADNRRQTD